MDRSLKRKPYSFLLNAPIADSSDIIAIVKTSNETDEDLAKIKSHYPNATIATSLHSFIKEEHEQDDTQRKVI